MQFRSIPLVSGHDGSAWAAITNRTETRSPIFSGISFWHFWGLGKRVRYPFRSGVVDLFKTVAARDPKHCDALWKTIIERAFEQFRQDRQLLHAWRSHVSCVVFQGYEEPGTGHGLILEAPTVPDSNSRRISHYFIGEKTVGRMYVESTYSTSLSACSAFIIS